MEEKLIEAAVAAVAGALAKAVAEPVPTAGTRIWTWLKGKMAGTTTVADIETAPARSSVPTKIKGLLQDLLEADPSAEKELRGLLDAHGGLQAVMQSATVTGDNNRIGQVSGSGNTVNIG